MVSCKSAAQQQPSNTFLGLLAGLGHPNCRPQACPHDELYQSTSGDVSSVTEPAFDQCCVVLCCAVLSSSITGITANRPQSRPSARLKNEASTQAMGRPDTVLLMSFLQPDARRGASILAHNDCEHIIHGVNGM